MPVSLHHVVARAACTPLESASAAPHTAAPHLRMSLTAVVLDACGPPVAMAALISSLYILHRQSGQSGVATVMLHIIDEFSIGTQAQSVDHHRRPGKSRTGSHRSRLQAARADGPAAMGSHAQPGATDWAAAGSLREGLDISPLRSPPHLYTASMSRNMRLNWDTKGCPRLLHTLTFVCGGGAGHVGQLLDEAFGLGRLAAC